MKMNQQRQLSWKIAAILGTSFGFTAHAAEMVRVDNDSHFTTKPRRAVEECRLIN